MKLGTLVTVANPREAMRNAEEATKRDIPVIVDSGAWSNFTGAASVTLEDHATYLKANWVDGARHIALDVIQDPDGSYRNWLTERRLGLDVEPTIHYGTPPEFIDKYLDEGLGSEWVNLGGMAHLQGKRHLHRKLAAWSAAIMNRCPVGTKFHALGGTTPGLNHLIAYHGVDSTYWLQVHKWNTVPLFDHETPKWVVVPRGLKGKDWKNGKSQRLGRLSATLQRSFGVSATDVANMGDSDLTELAFISHRQFGRHFEERHGHKMIVYLAGSSIKEYEIIEKLNQEEQS